MLSRRVMVSRLCLLGFPILVGCTPAIPSPEPTAATTSRVRELGSIEVTARLVEIPEGAIVRRELYDYAAVLKYEVLQVHRGELEQKTIYVGQYNPLKPRHAVADRRVPEIGGNVETLQEGQVHRLALEAPIEDVFMGGIVNKYFGQPTGPIYFAVWTDSASD
jgi:hypothetical protein